MRAVLQYREGYLLVSLEGAAHSASAPLEMSCEVFRVISEERRRAPQCELVFDLRDLTDIDGESTVVLLEFVTELAREARTRLVGPGAAIRRLSSRARLDAPGLFAPTIRSALAEGTPLDPAAGAWAELLHDLKVSRLECSEPRVDGHGEGGEARGVDDRRGPPSCEERLAVDGADSERAAESRESEPVLVAAEATFEDGDETVIDSELEALFLRGQSGTVIENPMHRPIEFDRKRRRR